MITLKSVRTLLTSAIAAIVLFAAPATYAADEDVLPTAGDDVETFWTASFWTIYKNNSRQSCFIEWRGETSVVQAGLTIVQDAYYLGAFVKGFEPEEGQGDIAIVLNGNLYVGDVTTVSRTLSDGFKGGYILVRDEQFVTDLEEAREFVAFPDSPNIVTVTLQTPKNAISRAQECMASF